MKRTMSTHVLLIIMTKQWKGPVSDLVFVDVLNMILDLLMQGSQVPLRKFCSVEVGELENCNQITPTYISRYQLAGVGLGFGKPPPCYKWRLHTYLWPTLSTAISAAHMHYRKLSGVIHHLLQKGYFSLHSNLILSVLWWVVLEEGN